MNAALDTIRRATSGWLIPKVLGRVTEVAGTLVQISVTEKNGPGLGDVLEVETATGVVPCEVVGFRGEVLLAIPLVPARNIAAGAPARPTGRAADVAVGDALLGRVIDPFGLPMDGGSQPRCSDRVPLDGGALPIDQRAGVNTRFDTGVRVIDGMLTCGRGQRIGIFAGAGCGKSVLVEQIASQGEADVIVIGLIGERGREVVELMSSHRRNKMIIVAATSDRSPLERLRGASAATAIAEYFRDRGKNVLLVIDSLTRFAMATREIGLALGEPPATKGYPPSVFANMPRLLERVAPRVNSGSITAFYTVLVEGDDLSDPVADSARSLLDAHIVLSRDLAGRGHFPAIDILASASRVARRVAGAATVQLAGRAREQLAQRKQAQELQALGAYTVGVNKDLDHALATGLRIDAWARQTPEEASTHELALAGLTAALETK
ncbi:flagellar protein export ATPase FliI [soil metagenome]